MHIVLDIDGTLISEGREDYKERPHLHNFLKYCFDNFETVSIWTAASSRWYNEIYENVLEPILKSIDKKFYQQWTENKCTVVSQIQNRYYQQYYDIELNFNSYHNRIKIKKLRRFFKSKNHPHTKHNTLILDNTPETFKNNYGNGIQVKTYTGQEEDDNELLIIIPFLEKLKLEYEKNESIRYYEKRNWKNSIDF